MKLRLNFETANPEMYQTMLKLEEFISNSGLDIKLYKLLKIRASQLNGCDFCNDMHTQAMRTMGEAEERINLISSWRDTPYYSEVEKVVLELTEAVTFIANTGVPEQLYDRVRIHFDENQYMTLIMAINTINCWNRIAISTEMYPGCFI